MSQGSSFGKSIIRTGIGPESLRSVLIVIDLDALRGSCFIPKEFQLVLPGLQGRIRAPPIGSIGVYEEALKADLHFPLHPFVERILEMFELSLAQVTPNSCCYIVGFLSLSSLLGRRPTLGLFRACFCLKRHPSSGGWWYFSPRSNHKIVLYAPSSIHGWKICFLFIAAEVLWGFKIA